MPTTTASRLLRPAQNSQTFLFLIKAPLVIAQPLDASETGELLVSLLRQGFIVGPVTIQAADSRQALDSYDPHAQLQVLTTRLQRSKSAHTAPAHRPQVTA